MYLDIAPIKIVSSAWTDAVRMRTVVGLAAVCARSPSRGSGTFGKLCFICHSDTQQSKPAYQAPGK